MNPVNIPLHKPVVAVIDDDEIYLEYVRMMISEYTHSTAGFTDLESCLDYIRDFPGAFDLLIVDRFLADADAVKDRFPEACTYLGYKGRVVLLSSSISASSEFEYRKLGFYRSINKGSDIDWSLLISSNV